MIKEKAENIIDSTNIGDSIIFESKYAPMIIAELTIEEIEEVARNVEVEEISYYSSSEVVQYSDYQDDYIWNSKIKPYYETFLNFINSMKINIIKYNSGLTGEDVKIGMIEPGTCQYHNEYLPTSRCTIVGGSGGFENHIIHANKVALILAGSDGIASGAHIYSANLVGKGEIFFEHVDMLLDKGVKLINMSASLFEDNEETFESSKYINFLTLNYNVTFVNSAGNNGDEEGTIGYPGRSDNIITVGAYENYNNTDITDDVMWERSSYFDQNNCSKPDVVAPGRVLGDVGTSFAAPVVTGTIALMLECRPSLALHPEVIKAIVMASCQHKALPYGDDEQETMAQGITEKQGAGVFDPYLALCITANGNYGYGMLGGEEEVETVRFYQSPYDATGMNISMAWLKNDSETVEAPRRNLDLSLRINDVYASETTETSSSTEMIYSSISNTSLTRHYDTEICYEFDIIYEKDDTYDDSERIRYGYAWCTNSEEYNNIAEFEGLYSIKNISANKYLSLNWETNEFSLRKYVDHTYNEYDQLFLITASDIGGHKISSAFTYDDGMTVSGNSVVNSTASSDITISQNEDGEYIFMADSKYLTFINNGLYWSDELTEHGTWHLEKINYRLGDMDFSGIINRLDENYVIACYDGSYRVNNSERYMADVNKDGTINYYDVIAVFDKYN